MELSKGTKATIWMGGICFAQLIGMLAFRAFIYADMYKAPDDPYGISDIIEFLLGSVFLVFLAVSGILSLALFFKGNAQSKKSAAFLVLFCVIL
ncbi:MAG: hypothetical protein KKE30_15785, partial [Gammaproteobacteria bacterium]|nr:hypothetical protein [Gammaproteobacteria bacterium]